MSNTNNTKYGTGSLKNNTGNDNSAFGAFNSYMQTIAKNNVLKVHRRLRLSN